MNISKEEIKHLANLSKLEFTDAEIEKLQKDLEEIVGFANSLNEINTDNITERDYILDNENVLRKDEVKPSFDRKEMLKNAITKEAGCVSVPKTIMD